MNVLIIDDQPDVVAGIHSGINWGCAFHPTGFLC